MLRVHFTPEDLTRVRIRPEPLPLWEVLLSLHLLQTRHGDVVFGQWRRRARPALSDILTTLAPPKGYSPDFLTPAVDSADLEVGLEALLSTRRQTLHSELSRLAEQTPLPGWVRPLAAGEPRMLRLLADTIRRYHATALQPYTEVFRAHIREEWTRRTEVVMAHGLEHALRTLHPSVRWRAPVLEVGYPVDQDLYLDGRGLVLVPSFFCWQTSMTFANPSLRPVLVYPVTPDLGWVSARPGAPDQKSLIALLGRTRATVLRTIADKPGLNTTELAREARTSPAGASQHATVLRQAGLVITKHSNGCAVHTLSTKGAALLRPSSPSAG
ncbi:helix-turn-helix domain-containing protein [Actinocrispum sp. NPDC049592]|uniref:ArsR/SmtB family transcription factor n=1 Tax=Actinocrispum sp. NPDC049592 TaxID=3154835 RepID=UPI00342D66D5